MKIFHWFILFLFLSAAASEVPKKPLEEVVASMVTVFAETGGMFNAGQQAAIDPSTGKIYVLTDILGVKQDYHGVGTVIDPKGLIVTNFHTVKDASRITVTFYNGKKYDATLAHQIPDKDIALLQIKPEEKISAIDFGDSDQLKHDQNVYLIGITEKIRDRVASGQILGLDRLKEENRGPDGSLNIIQVVLNLELSEGDSGTPVLDEDGRFLGMITAGHTVSKNPIYAIPANSIKNRYLEFLKSRSN